MRAIKDEASMSWSAGSPEVAHAAGMADAIKLNAGGFGVFELAYNLPAITLTRTRMCRTPTTAANFANRVRLRAQYAAGHEHFVYWANHRGYR